MDKSRMVHKNDEITRRFYQVDKLLLENPKYKDLSDGAILAWSILRDRLELSKENADVFSDEEGYLYLIYTDEELATILHRTRNTASARKKELEKFSLLYNVRMGNQEPNRLYILEPEKCDPAEYISNQYRKKKKAELAKKKLETAKKQKRKYMLIEIDPDDEISYPQGESLGGVVMPKNCASLNPKNRASGCPNSGHPDAQNLGCSDTEQSDTKFSETNKLEEEGLIEKSKTINVHFPKLIKETLGNNDVYDDEMIGRIIIEMNKKNVSFLTKEEMITQHRKMLKKYEEGESIWDWANYFVGGILKNRLSESTAIRQNRLAEAKKFDKETEQIEQNSKKTPAPFYNWLEE